MEPIGSVIKNNERKESQSSVDSDFSIFTRESDTQALQILQCNGQAAYEDYLQQQVILNAHNNEQDRQQAIAKRACKARARAIARRLLNVKAMIERKLSSHIAGAGIRYQTLLSDIVPKYCPKE